MSQTFPRNPFTREDTLFGVCEALGEDFGFNPLLLRVAFAVGILVSPTVAIGSYFALGAIVLVSRLVVPNPRRPKAVDPDVAETEATPQPLHADNETVADMLAVAA